MTKDLTVGKVSRVILSFSIPLLISSIVQQLYNMADSAIVGKFDSSLGLAAIGGAYPVTLFVIGICTGAGMGSSVLISSLFGAKRMKDLKNAVYTSLVSFAVLGAVLSTAGFFMAGLFMRWLGVNYEVFNGAKTYLSIYCLGSLPMLLYNAVSATFTGMGDSRRPLYFLVGSSVLNVILDIIAVAVLKLGVLGAAWATVVSQIAVAAVSLILLIRKMRAISTGGESASLFNMQNFKELVSIALPCILQQLTVSIAMILIQGLVNTYGTAVMAGYEVGSKVVNFIYSCFNAMATGLMSFAGQNFGAGEVGRCKEGFKITALVCCIFAVIICILGNIIPDQIVGIFVNSAEENISEVIRVGSLFLRIVTFDQVFVSIVLSLGGLMRGVGDIKAFVIATIADLGTRVLACYAFTAVMGSYVGLYWAWYAGMIVDFIICAGWYIRETRNGKL